MTLSERFAMYQRKAAEVEMRKPRKSPEIHRYAKLNFLTADCFVMLLSLLEPLRVDIRTFLLCHRRIDVSPSAFKRHSHLFEDMEEASYKVTSPFEI